MMSLQKAAAMSEKPEFGVQSLGRPGYRRRERWEGGRS